MSKITINKKEENINITVFLGIFSLIFAWWTYILKLHVRLILYVHIHTYTLTNASTHTHTVLSNTRAMSIHTKIACTINTIETYIYIHTYKCTHTHTHTHTYIHTHTYTNIAFLWKLIHYRVSRWRHKIPFCG